MKRMIEAAEQSIAEQALANVQAGFKAGIQGGFTNQQQQDKVQSNPSLNLNSLDKIY